MESTSCFLLVCRSACNAVDVLDPRPDTIFLIRDLFRTLDSGQIGSCAELRNLVGISSGQQDAEEFETVLLARIQNELADLSMTEVRAAKWLVVVTCFDSQRAESLLVRIACPVLSV